MQVFGWAVKQMEHGSRVRRASQDVSYTISRPPSTGPFLVWVGDQVTSVVWLFAFDDIVATDWEIAE